MNIGFIGLGAMGAGIVPRLMAAGHTVTGWNRSRDKAEPLIKAGMRFADTPRAVASRLRHRVLDRDRCRGRARGRARSPTASSPASSLAGIYIDMSTIAPDASRAVGGRVRRQGPRHARRADLGQPGHARARQRLGHGRRRQGGVRARRAGAARDRPEGDLYRRERACGADEDRGQSPAHGRGDRVRRSGRARRERRRRSARSRSMPSSRASPHRPCSAIAGRSSWKARCRKCRSPTSRCSRRTCCSRSSRAASSAARCRSRPPPTR